MLSIEGRRPHIWRQDLLDLRSGLVIQRGRGASQAEHHRPPLSITASLKSMGHLCSKSMVVLYNLTPSMANIATSCRHQMLRTRVARLMINAATDCWYSGDHLLAWWLLTGVLRGSKEVPKLKSSDVPQIEHHVRSYSGFTFGFQQPLESVILDYLGSKHGGNSPYHEFAVFQPPAVNWYDS